MQEVRKSVLILIGGHFAAAPRPQKEAAALAQAGHCVAVRGVWWSEALGREDTQIAAKIGVEFAPLVDVRAGGARTLLSRLKRRAAQEMYQRVGYVTPRCYGISGPEMLAQARLVRPDLVIVHSEAGLWAGAKLIKDGFRVGVDFEDWFSQDLGEEARKQRPIAGLKALEQFHLRNARFCLTTTNAMAKALAEDAGVDRVPAVVPNVFPFAARESAQSLTRDARGDEVSLYWYSQTIGPGRGLENLGQALAMVKGNWRLRLRGVVRAPEGWFENAFPLSIRDRVELLHPVPNDQLLARHMSHDLGLALEIPYCANKNLTSANKLFDYLRAGLAIVATDTAGQQEVMQTCPDAGWLVSAENIAALASALQEAVAEPASLAAKKRAAVRACEQQWSWERHVDTLLDTINRVIYS